MNPGGVMSAVVNKVSFATYLPILVQATADDDNSTPGYLFDEITDISFQRDSTCQQLFEYLTRRLERPSSCVKLKVLKIMHHLVKHGHVGFRQRLRRNDGSIKLATMYNGRPDPLLGMSAYEMVRKVAQELLDVLFDPVLIKNDEDQSDAQQVERTKVHLGGLGTSMTPKGKYEGFGSSPRDKEETVKEKVMDLLDKYINPVDESAQRIEAALTSSPGEYKAVEIKTQPDERVACIASPIRTHVPGRAGGGWESDEDDSEQLHSLSNVTASSLETADAEICGASYVEKQMVLEFCHQEEWPVLLKDLHDICQKCHNINSLSVIKTIAEILEQKSSSDLTKTRSLLIVEWFLRKDLVYATTMTELFSSSFSHILHEDSQVDARLKMKTKKITLILEKLIRGHQR